MSKKLIEVLRTLTFIPLACLIGYVVSAVLGTLVGNFQQMFGLDPNNFLLKGAVTFLAWNITLTTSISLKPNFCTKISFITIWSFVIGIYLAFILYSLKFIDDLPTGIYWWYYVIEGLGPLIVGYLILKDGKIIWQKDNE